MTSWSLIIIKSSEGLWRERGKNLPEIQFICKTCHVALKYVHNDEKSDFRKSYKNKVSANYRFWGKHDGVERQGFRTKAL